MRRKLSVIQEVAPISLWGWEEGGSVWTDAPENQLKFEYREGGVEGTIALNLDFMQMTDWDSVFDESGKLVTNVPLACRRILVIIDAECNERVTEMEFLKTAQRLTDRYVNKMLSYVRVELSQHWVTPLSISEWGVRHFLYQGLAELYEDGRPVDLLDRIMVWDRTQGDRSFDDRGAALYKSRREAVRAFIQEGGDPPPERELIASAKQHFVTSEYRVAAVEGVSALELGLEQFVRKRCKERRISRKYRDVSGEFGVSVLLKLLLPLELSDKELGCCRGLINRCDKLRKVRNKVVHDGSSPNQREINDIRQGIKAAEDLLDFIKGLENSDGESSCT